MGFSRRNAEALEAFLGEIGERYVNLVVDGVGLAIPSAYCAYAIAGDPRGCIVFIDGGNSFNPYHITRYSRLFSIDEREVMENIQLSRAFTCHQMSALLGDRLESAVERFSAETVVISEPASLYVERAAEEDVLEELSSAHRRLLRVTYSRGLTTLLVHSSRIPRLLEGGALEEGRRQRAARYSEMMLSGLSDSIYRLEEGAGELSVTRVKHPLFPAERYLSIPTGPRMMTLDELLQGSAS
jgi:hypothetical protein